ncbi:GDP-Man:Man(3)GlcNAc(2)-PP-Dol alpha-1,2-mannosyltransferase [Aphelenchoides bicaudatus]|nr:GDP-Man:Man(3)GlcNAc(2)-PP-Dol alpha-1,2-mannosyltransferase [Aphelenchoides bicaudatus]
MLLFFGSILLLTTILVFIRLRRRNAIAFLHPYCEQGGGGEVVLWKAVEALRERIKKKNECCSIYIYTTVMDAATLEKAKKNIRERFGFDMNAKDNVDAVQFVHITTRTLLEPKWYPRFTLFGQFLGGGHCFPGMLVTTKSSINN